MRKIVLRLIILLSFSLLFSCGDDGSKKKLNHAEEELLQEKERVLVEIEKLVQSGVSDRVLIAWIKKIKSPIVLEATDIIRLKKSKMSERVIRSLIDR